MSERVQALRAASAGRDADPRVPVELVTTSASGLDNNLTPAAALWRVPGIGSSARQLSVERVAQLVNPGHTNPAAELPYGQPVSVYCNSIWLDA